MKVFCFLVMLCLVLTLFLSACGGWNIDIEAEWNKIFGGSGLELGYCVQQTSDGGYIVVGNTFPAGGGYEDAWLIKTDSDGNKKWNKILGGPKGDEGYFVQQTSDGGYIIAGITEMPGFSYGGQRIRPGDAWLVKTGSNGNELWNKTFGGAEGDVFYCVRQTSDGGYIVTGATEYYETVRADVWLIKTDANGNELWNKTFGGSVYDKGYCVRQTSDGGYIVVGSTNSYGAGGEDLWLIKTGSNGNELWNKTFGGSLGDSGRSVQQTSDGGYIIAGTVSNTREQNIWLIKFVSRE